MKNNYVTIKKTKITVSETITFGLRDYTNAQFVILLLYETSVKQRTFRLSVQTCVVEVRELFAQRLKII